MNISINVNVFNNFNILHADDASLLDGGEKVCPVIQRLC